MRALIQFRRNFQESVERKLLQTSGCDFCRNTRKVWFQATGSRTGSDALPVISDSLCRKNVPLRENHKKLNAALLIGTEFRSFQDYLSYLAQQTRKIIFALERKAHNGFPATNSCFLYFCS